MDLGFFSCNFSYSTTYLVLYGLLTFTFSAQYSLCLFRPEVGESKSEMGTVRNSEESFPIFGLPHPDRDETGELMLNWVWVEELVQGNEMWGSVSVTFGKGRRSWVL